MLCIIIMFIAEIRKILRISSKNCYFHRRDLFADIMYLISTIITVLGLLFPATVDSYQNGAPIKACGFLNPGHGVTDQLVPSPYLITPSQTTYQCRETIKGMFRLISLYRVHIPIHTEADRGHFA